MQQPELLTLSSSKQQFACRERVSSKTVESVPQGWLTATRILQRGLERLHAIEAVKDDMGTDCTQAEQEENPFVQPTEKARR